MPRHPPCALYSLTNNDESGYITDSIPTCIALQALVLGSFVFTNILVFSRMSCIFCVKDIVFNHMQFSRYNSGCNRIQVGLSGLEPPTSRLSGVRSNQLSYKPILIWQPPALPCRLQHSTIGRLGLNHRVRDGNGCVP